MPPTQKNQSPTNFKMILLIHSINIIRPFDDFLNSNDLWWPQMTLYLWLTRVKSYLDCLDLRFDYYFSKLTQIRLSNWLFDDISSIWRRLRKCFPAYAFSVICFYDLKYKHEGCWWRKNDLLVIYVHFMDFDHWFCVGCSSEPTLTTIPHFFAAAIWDPNIYMQKEFFVYLYPVLIFSGTKFGDFGQFRY